MAPFSPMKKLWMVAALFIAACGPKPGTHGATNASANKTAIAATGTHEAVPGALQPGRVDPGTVPMDVKMKASRGAAEGVVYTNALAAIYAPADVKEFPAYEEFGWRKAGNYKTWGAFPAGWWVYVEPYWVVWDLKNGQREN